jgi:hypothetical protein
MAAVTPTVGRVVHYVSYGTPVQADGSQAYTAQCRAAVVTQVLDTDPKTGQPNVGLCVLNPTGQFFNPDIPYSDESGHAGGTWHWPERV